MPKRKSILAYQRKRGRSTRPRVEDSHVQMTDNSQSLPLQINQTVLPQALSYSPDLDLDNVDIGELNKICPHCLARKFNNEPPRMCCHNGKVMPQIYPPLPEFLNALFHHNSVDSEHFLSNAKKYNCVFQLTSFGCKEVTVAGWNPSFRIHGQIFHRVGALLPVENAKPQFLQIYFIDGDSDSEVNARMGIVDGLRQNVVTSIQTELHEFNNYIRELKTAYQFASENGMENFSITIMENKRPAGEHVRRYNAPETKEIGILMPGDPVGERDIVLRQRDNVLKRISEFHPAYDALQYPLLFPRGTHGWNLGLKLNMKLTILQFYSFQIITRPGNYILLARKLFQQFLVDIFAKIETERLLYIRREQKRLRVDSYGALRDAFHTGDGDPQNVGQRIVLPSSFVGGPRYMFERQQDAMCYVRKYGRADLFVTMTTNPNWVEIQRNLSPNQKAHDRPDLTVRVFRLKLQVLLSYMKQGCFGTLNAWLYSIEFQKRGLPHAHILLWLSKNSKIRPDNIDHAVSAELPDIQTDPQLFDIVKTNMIHGPCGENNVTAPCMKNGTCSKGFPKPFIHNTEIGNDSYPKYRRRSPMNGGQEVVLERRNASSTTLIKIDNRWVVPYNPWLLRQMNCHLNVELCSSIKSIKYVLKYVHKGSDQATFKVTEQATRDEVSDFINARYIGSTEAAWRIFSMPMHERFPPVMQLAVHLENGQRVFFTEENAYDRSVSGPPDSTLTAFFKLCEADTFACTLLYCHVPSFYTWSKKTWTRRKRGTLVEGHDNYEVPMIGRIFTVSPRQGECFFLRLLLHHVRGPKNFEDLRTVEGRLCHTYRDACLQRGLLKDDNAHHLALQEASVTLFPKQLRQLFAVMVIHCEIYNLLDLWTRHSQLMCEDFLTCLSANESDAENAALVEIENMVMDMGGNMLTQYGLPEPQHDHIERLGIDYKRETSYDIDKERHNANQKCNLLNAEQRTIHNSFVACALSSTSGIFFLDAPGGCGKTFLIQTILATIRSQNKIVIATASSGLAATLLSGGRTIHSTFKVPLNLTNVDLPMCSIKKGTALARLIKECCALVIDEAPMTNKLVFEALSRSLCDITGKNEPMGGIATLLCGDFRQILPVVVGGTRANIVNSCIKSSVLWSCVTPLQLRTNMRVHLSGNTEAGIFADLLLRLGDGLTPVIENPDTIDLHQFGICVQTTKQLIDSVFTDFAINFSNAKWLTERAILTPLNDTASKINFEMMQKIPGSSMVYLSIDTAVTDEESTHYPTEFLNSIELAGLPSHKLSIKVGMPVMVMRSLTPPRIMNGTRCIVIKTTANTVIVKIASGPYGNEIHCIPRISLQPSDSSLPFSFVRRQFPLQPCMAMTINKAQGQTMKVIGLHLETPVFAHGMLYVALSRTGNKNSNWILAPESKSRNVVYPEALH